MIIFNRPKKRSHLSERTKNILQGIVVCLFFSLFSVSFSGVAIYVAGTNLVYQELAQNGYPVKGLITAKDIYGCIGNDPPIYEISYSYEVPTNGTIYKSTENVSSLQYSSLKIGRTFTVFISPTNPKIHVPEFASIDWTLVYGFGFFGIIFTLIAVISWRILFLYTKGRWKIEDLLQIMRKLNRKIW